MRANEDRKARLSTLWVFATLCYLYCDVITLMDSAMLKRFLAGTVGSMPITQGFLLGASVLMMIPISMVILSRILKPGASRWANIVAATIMTLVQAASLFAGKPTLYYSFFSAFEIAATVFIFVSALRWKAEEAHAT
jgi:hypothetical protein